MNVFFTMNHYGKDPVPVNPDRIFAGQGYLPGRMISEQFSLIRTSARGNETLVATLVADMAGTFSDPLFRIIPNPLVMEAPAWT